MSMSALRNVTASLFGLLLGAGLTEAGEHPPLPVQALGKLSGPRMMADVARLSSPAYNGRQAGTLEDARSGLFVAERFRVLGLRPIGDQTFKNMLPAGTPAGAFPDGPWVSSRVVTARHIGNNPQFLLMTDPPTLAQPGSDYLPLLDSPATSVTASVVFVGYGISDPARGFDEYEGLDVQNRIVLFLRGKPPTYPIRISHAEKERVARYKGAVAFLTATGPVLSGYEARRGMTTEPLAYYGRPEARDQHPIPGAWISATLAEVILSGEESGQSGNLQRVQEQLAEQLAPRSRHTPTVLRLAWESTETSGLLVNVLGAILGEGPEAHDIVVVGAHRDHFGRQAGLLFPGADDNASGTAVILEVARALSQSESKPKRTIVFVSFSGEEPGLLGSRHYVNRPPVPLQRTVAMVNVDHMGVGNGRLTVGVTGLPRTVTLKAGELVGLEKNLDIYGFFPGGDHVPFKEAGVPTITVVSAGPHPHFHKPTDTSQTVNAEILKTATAYLLALTWHLANAL